MAQSARPTPQASDEVLRAQLAIAPEKRGQCAIATQPTDIETVSQHLKQPERETTEQCQQKPYGECHLEVTHESGTDSSREYVTNAITEHCLCLVFQQHDCIPTVKGTRSGELVVVVTVPNRAALRSLIEELQSTGASITVDWLLNHKRNDTTIEVDVSTVTNKQQEALELAVESGYYDTPRRATLGDLAAQMGRSESAISQRLNAAETKLVKAFLES